MPKQPPHSTGSQLPLEALPGGGLALKRIRDLPSLPTVIHKLMTMMQDPNIPASQISELISYDPGLGSRVLRMVNSAAFGFQRHISSIQHGIMILGFNAVRGVVLSASVLKLFEGKSHPGGLNHEAFWWHSTATALTAKFVSDKLHLAMDDAFTAGMLHDMGKLVLDVYFTEFYQPVLQCGYNHPERCHGVEFLSREAEMLGTTHAEVGAELAAQWKLPANIADVMRYHHNPEHVVPSHQKLVAAVCLANGLVTYLALDKAKQILIEEPLSDLPDCVWTFLAIEREKALSWLPEIEAVLEDAGQVFQQ